jgi:hypothetical protein
MPTSLLAVFAVFLLAAPEIVERVLVVVDGRPLLLSEARAVAATRGVSLEDAQDLLVDETLMYEQASRTPQSAVSAEEEHKAQAALLEMRPALGNEVGGAELRRLLRRQLAVLKYVDFRFRPQARPSEEELRRAYAEAHSGSIEAPAYEAVEEALRERLIKEKLDAAVEAWIKELRAAAEIRRVSGPNGIR